MTAARVLIATAAVVTSVGLAACAHTGTTHGGPSVGSSQPSAPPASLALTDDANGRTVDAQVGEAITVTLSTTNWTFGAVSDAGVLTQAKQRVTFGPVGCRSLRNCGSVDVRLLAAAPGRAIVRATREKCGELVRCTGAAALFTVTVVVHA